MPSKGRHLVSADEQQETEQPLPASEITNPNTGLTFSKRMKRESMMETTFIAVKLAKMRLKYSNRSCGKIELLILLASAVSHHIEEDIKTTTIIRSIL